MKKNIVVLFGGPSVERDVSIISAFQAVTNADDQKYMMMPVFWSGDEFYSPSGSWESAKDVAKLVANKRGKVLFDQRHVVYKDAGLFTNRKQRVDVVLPIFHGTGGEDGVIQGFLESLDIPYAGSGVTASAIGMDKALFKVVMKQSNIPVLDFKVVTKESGIDLKSLPFDFPVIAKPAHLGSSIGVKKCENVNDMHQALEVIFELDTHALIEPYLSDMKEINCSVLGTTGECKTSVCEEPLSADEILSFEDKYLKGGKGKNGAIKGMASLDRRIPAQLDKSLEEKIRKLAEDVYKACGCSGVARVDCMVKGQDIYVTEINTIPGSLSFYLWEASGISFRELLDKLVEGAEYEYTKKKSLLRTFESTILDKQI